MKRIILAVALAAVSAVGGAAGAATDPAFRCDLQITFPQFPEVGLGSAVAEVDTLSTCTFGVGGVDVADSTYTYDDVGCQQGSARGALVIDGQTTPFVYRRVGTEVKMDLLHGDQHYSALFQIVFTDPNPSTPGGLAQIAGACNGAPITPAAVTTLQGLGITT